MYFSIFNRQEIGDAGALEIADFLKSDMTLATLNLKSNSIGTKGGIAIAQALQLNDGLTKLDLSYNKVNDLAGFEMASILQVRSFLIDFPGKQPSRKSKYGWLWSRFRLIDCICYSLEQQ
jgi:hypothetical protein